MTDEIKKLITERDTLENELIHVEREYREKIGKISAEIRKRQTNSQFEKLKSYWDGKTMVSWREDSLPSNLQAFLVTKVETKRKHELAPQAKSGEFYDVAEITEKGVLPSKRKKMKMSKDGTKKLLKMIQHWVKRQ